jgi:hypothetical protein
MHRLLNEFRVCKKWEFCCSEYWRSAKNVLILQVLKQLRITAFDFSTVREYENSSWVRGFRDECIRRI